MVSLAAVTAAFRVPWGGAPQAVGWGASSAERFAVTFGETEPPEPEADLASRYRLEPSAGNAPARAARKEPEDRAATAGARPEEPALPPSLEKLAPILEFAEKAPELVGGLGGLYLQIRYPQAAIERGIQGRVILKFVVEPDGRTSGIVVEKSLHALCDSAAVQALRKVTFLPGRHEGRAARVRMRLPVRFQLVDKGGLPLTDSSLASAG